MSSLPDFLFLFQAAIGIGLVIFVHELGHFLAARYFGVRVEVFSIGMGPRILGWQRGDTMYQLALIPIGGYVRMAGEDRRFEGLPPEPDDLNAKSVGARFVVYSGGVVMNLIFGLVAFPLVFYFGVPFTPPILGDPTPGGPAWQAGLERGTEVLEANGQEVFDFVHIHTAVALGDSDHATLRVRTPDGVIRDVELDPRYDESFGMNTIDVPGAYERDDQGRLLLFPTPDSPAARAGVLEGDALVAVVDGDPALSTLAQLERALDGEPVELVVAGPEGERRVRIEPTPTETLSKPIIGVAPPVQLVTGLRGRARGLVPGVETRSVLLTAVDDREVLEHGDFMRALLAAQAGTGAATLRFEVDGEALEREVTLDSPEDARAWGRDIALGLDRETNRIVVSDGDPAQRAGLVSGDRLAKLQGEAVTGFQDVLDRVKLANEAGTSLAIQVMRPSGEVNLDIRPEGSPIHEYGLSTRPARYTFQIGDPLEALWVGAVCSWRFTQETFLTIKRFFTQDVSTRNVGGIITIGIVSSSWAEEAWTKLLYFLCILSINLAVINVLPVPLLDGGHLVFLIVEKLKGSPVSERVLVYSQMVGLVLILSLLVFVMYVDVVRWFGPAG